MKNVMRVAALAAAAALTLTACGSAPETSPTPTEEDTASPTETATEEPTEEPAAFKGCMVSDFGGFDDNSFNESGFAGLERAESELGIEIAWAESTDAADYGTNVDAMVQADCDLIVTVGFNLADATAAAATTSPDQHFALIDSTLDPALDNVRPLVFNTQEAAFLAGYVAAGMSSSGIVATYGGMAFPSVTIFMDGYVDGVNQYNTDNGTSVSVLGWDKEAQNGVFAESFDDIARGSELTDQFIAQGADVIMPVAGPLGGGTLASAAEAGGVLVIGVDSDAYEQDAYEPYRGIILTSVLKEIGQSVFDAISDASSGTFTSDPYVGTLENGGVSIAPFHDLDAQVPEELKARLAELTEEIVAGTLVVDSPSSN